MKDAFAANVVLHGDNPELCAILTEVCRLTGMGFAAIARVTEDRWIACQVLDRIEFGLKPGDELDVATTICDDIRQSGHRIVIDHVAEDKDWCTHPTPILYGFRSYASLPIVLDDGSFYGTLCAIDPAPNRLNHGAVLEALEDYARQAAALLSRTLNSAA